MFELKMTNSLFTRFDRAIERHVRTMEYLIYWKWICTFFLFEIYQMMRPIFLWASSVAWPVDQFLKNICPTVQW